MGLVTFFFDNLEPCWFGLIDIYQQLYVNIETLLMLSEISGSGPCSEKNGRLVHHDHHDHHDQLSHHLDHQLSRRGWKRQRLLGVDRRARWQSSSSSSSPSSSPSSSWTSPSSLTSTSKSLVRSSSHYLTFPGGHCRGSGWCLAWCNSQAQLQV